MNVARIDASGVVVNIEAASTEFVAARSAGEDGFTFVPYTDDNPAWIGLGYDAETGTFEQPPLVPPPPVEGSDNG